MNIAAIALELRPRPMWEAADLGVRLLQANARAVARCWLPVAGLVLLLCLATIELANWLPTTLIFLAKPWLGRSVLFVLARAAFGQSSRFDDLWAARRAVWWRQFWRAISIDRLLPWRTFVLPVVQLEGLAGAARRARVRQLARGRRGGAAMLNLAYVHVEYALLFGLLGLVLLLAPVETAGSLWETVTTEQGWLASLLFALAYALVVLLLEPFHVASGFALYLNRRVELEAWDIEQEFRRAFAPLAGAAR